MISQLSDFLTINENQNFNIRLRRIAIKLACYSVNIIGIFERNVLLINNQPINSRLQKEVKSNTSDKALPSSDLRGRHCFQTAPQRLALPTSPGLMQDTATFAPFMSSMVCSDYCSPTSFSQAQCFIWKTMKPNRNHCNDIVDVGASIRCSHIVGFL